jgi:hypothetical protein
MFQALKAAWNNVQFSWKGTATADKFTAQAGLARAPGEGPDETPAAFRRSLS